MRLRATTVIATMKVTPALAALKEAVEIQTNVSGGQR
jgi:hypothetical protein